MRTPGISNVVEPVEVFRVVLPWEKKSEANSGLDKTRIAVLSFTNISPDPKVSPVGFNFIGCIRLAAVVIVMRTSGNRDARPLRRAENAAIRPWTDSTVIS